MTHMTTISAQALQQRANLFRDILIGVASDEHHVVQAAIHYDPLRPLEDGDFNDAHPLHRDASPAGFHAYEDAGMTTGAMLAAQSLRYRVTGDSADLDAANNLFKGIRFIYEMGEAHASEGFFPKPYNAKPSDQVSRDQYLYAMSGLTAYLPIADVNTRPTVRRMLEKMARYWMVIDYTNQYFGLPASCHLDDFMGSLFLGIIRMAHSATDNAAFLTEYDRLIREHQLADRMGQTLLAHFRQGGTYDGGTYLRQQENPIAMKSMAIDHLWNADAERLPAWSAALNRFWQDDLLVPLDRQRGLNYFVVGWDAQTDTTYLTEPGVLTELENPLNLANLTWGGLRQCAGSTQTAYAAAIVADRLGYDEARDVAYDILSKLTLPDFRGWIVPDEQHLPPGHRSETCSLRSCYLAYWQWTYWLGRHRGLW